MMAAFDAVAIVPVFQCIFIINIIVSGSFYFDEFRSGSAVPVPALASLGACRVWMSVDARSLLRPCSVLLARRLSRALPSGSRASHLVFYAV